MRNIETSDYRSGQVLNSSMNCGECAELQETVEAAARELSRAIHYAMIAIAPISGIAAGNRIEQAEADLRSASDSLKKHQSACKKIPENRDLDIRR